MIIANQACLSVGYITKPNNTCKVFGTAKFGSRDTTRLGSGLFRAKSVAKNDLNNQITQSMLLLLRLFNELKELCVFLSLQRTASSIDQQFLSQTANEIRGVVDECLF